MRPHKERLGVRYQVLPPASQAPDLVEQTVTCLVKVWCGTNVVWRTLGITPEEFEPQARVRVHNCAEQGLSLIALDDSLPRDRCVIGFFLWEDARRPEETAHLQLSPKLRIQSAFLRTLYSEDVLPRSPMAGEPWLVHGINGGVLVGYTGRNVTTVLLLLSALHIRQQGYRWLVTEATHPASQHISRKLGWRQVSFSHFATFELDGTRPLAPAHHSGSLGCILFLLDLHGPLMQVDATGAGAPGDEAQRVRALPPVPSKARL